MGLLDRWLGKRDTQTATFAQMLGGYTPLFASMGSNAYESDIVRACVHVIAANAAKLKPVHIRSTDGQINRLDTARAYRLQKRPNPAMNTYDFLYKIVSQLYLHNNAFVLTNPDGYYPIDASGAQMLETPEGVLFVKFALRDGKQLTVPYSDVIHLRRHFCENELTGSANNKALRQTLEVYNTSNQGMVNAVKQSAFLRGLLKYSQVIKSKDLEERRNEFVRQHLSVTDSGGVAALDGTAEYVPLNGSPKTIDAPLMDHVRQNIYRYYGVNDSILQSKYTEDEWNAFYESVIEPLAVQLSLEFTAKTFTPRELDLGNEIVFEANRLQYASARTKIALVKTLIPYGMLTVNEGREVFNLGPVEGGDTRMQTLNVVNADKAGVYQLGSDDPGDGLPKTKGDDEGDDDIDGT